MSADAALRPPPNSKTTDESQMSRRSNVRGYAQTINISANDPATPSRDIAMILLRPRRSPSFAIGIATSRTTFISRHSNTEVKYHTWNSIKRGFPSSYRRKRMLNLLNLAHRFCYSAIRKAVVG
ncbi:unnamed protein product [Diplocarpon coronariae]